MEASRDLIFSTKKLKPRLSSLLLQHPGIRYEEADFIRISPVIDPGGLSGLDLRAPMIFTSGNALRIAGSHYAAVRAFTGVAYTLNGPSADEAARYLQGAQVRSFGVDGSELADRIVTERLAGTFTFFCGNKRRDVLPDRLRGAGLHVTEVLVYETSFAPQQLEQRPAAVLFFSPSTVESYLMANRLGAETVCIAIGNTTADLLRRQQYGLRILTAASPSQDAVVETLLNYLNTEKV